MLDAAAKKSVLRLFTYGLYIVTCRHGDDANAFTANWLSQASFEPPIVVLSIENASASLPMIRQSGYFGVNVLPSGARDLAGRFGRSRLKVGDKLSGPDYRDGAQGLPILDAALGFVACRVLGELPAGDSTLVSGEVVAAELLREGEPLTMREAGFRHSG